MEGKGEETKNKIGAGSVLNACGDGADTGDTCKLCRIRRNRMPMTSVVGGGHDKTLINRGGRKDETN